MSKRLVKYNPAFLEAEQLVKNFVVRQTDMELIVRIIRDNITDSNQHVLIIGPRGSGKTTLVLRIAEEIKRDDDLAESWYPLIFAEESYEVISAGGFWLEALWHLSEQTEDEKLKQTYSEIADETNDDRVRERALGQLMDFADKHHKKILLIVENINMLLGEQTGEDEAWKIRHSLINEPRIMMLATATTKFEKPEDLNTPSKMSLKSRRDAEKNRFVKLKNESHPMYELFKMHELPPLDDVECNAVWKLVTGYALEDTRIRAIKILTGGNPRLLTIIAKFGAHRSFRQLLDDLVDLVDDHTDYFKSQIESLPVTERKIYLALAGLWDTSTTHDIAKAARMDVNKTSSLLNRLVTRGFVLAEETNKRTRYYNIAERMYNIYYLMRRRGKPADRVKATVKFMVSMYDPESATKMITEEAGRLSPELCRDHQIAYGEIIKEIHDPQVIEKIIASTPASFLESPYIADTIRNFSISANKSENVVVKTGLAQAAEMIDDAFKQFKDNNYEQTINVLDAVIKRFGDSKEPAIIEQVAMALVNKGISLGSLGRLEDEIKAYDEVAARCGASKEPTIIELVTTALVYKGITFGTLGRPEDAIKAYDEVTARLGASKEPAIIEKVARALVNKGTSLGTLGRFEDEINIYDEVVARLGDSKEPAIIEKVAMALVNKGFRLGTFSRSEDAINVYDEVAARFGASKEPAIIEKVAMALVNKGITLGKLGRSEDAINVYDEVAARFGDRKEPAIIIQVAKALVNKGITLGKLSRHEDAIKAYDEIAARFGASKEPAIIEKVAMVLVNKGFRLGKLDRHEDAIKAYDEVAARFGASKEPVIIEKVATALVNKGASLGTLGRSEDEINIYDEVVARFGDSKEPAIIEQVAKALFNKGVTLGKLDRSEDAINVYDEVVAHFGDHKEPAIIEQVSMALVNKGFRLGTLGRSEDAINVYDEVAARFGDSKEPAIIARVARALVNKGITLGELGRDQQAETVLQDAIRLNSKTETYTELIKLLLKKQERQADALQLAEKIISEQPEDAKILNTVAWAFYKNVDSSMLQKAEAWSRRAVCISPDDLSMLHTLACILSALGKRDEALVSAGKYIQDESFVQKTINDAIELFVELAASGYAKDALELLINSPAAKDLEPLVAGLKLYLGEDVKTAVEILEVAKDVVKQIEERKQKRGIKEHRSQSKVLKF